MINLTDETENTNFPQYRCQRSPLYCWNNIHSSGFSEWRVAQEWKYSQRTYTHLCIIFIPFILIWLLRIQWQNVKNASTCGGLRLSYFELRWGRGSGGWVLLAVIIVNLLLDNAWSWQKYTSSRLDVTWISILCVRTHCYTEPLWWDGLQTCTWGGYFAK